jgi:hypothetical protein
MKKEKINITFYCSLSDNHFIDQFEYELKEFDNLKDYLNFMFNLPHGKSFKVNYKEYYK